jgi:hypothetical protein
MFQPNESSQLSSQYPESIEIDGQLYISEIIFQDELMKEKRELSILKYALWFVALFSIVTLSLLWPLILKGYSNQSLGRIENVR